MSPYLTEEISGISKYHEAATEKGGAIRSISVEDSILLSLEHAVKPSQNEFMIELGCGSGLRSLHLTKKHSLRLVLIDFTKASIMLSRENARNLGIPCDLVRCELKHLPFRNELFDIVWAEGTHEHTTQKDLPLAFGESRRIAKFGARLLIFVPNVFNPIYRVEWFVKDKFHLAELYENPLTRSELEYWISHSRFTVTGGEGLEVFYTLFSYSLFDLREVPPVIRPLYRIKRFITQSFYGREGFSSQFIRSLRKLDRNHLPRNLLGHEIGVVAVAN